MLALKLIAVGNSTGVIFPKDVLDELKVSKGDTLFITKSPDGYRITPYQPEFDEQMKAAREFMKDYRDTLRDLAK